MPLWAEIVINIDIVSQTPQKIKSNLNIFLAFFDFFSSKWRKPLLEGILQLFECSFFDATDIGAGNLQNLCDLALRHWALSRKTVAKKNDLPLARRKKRIDVAKRAIRCDLSLDLGGHAFVTADHVDVGQGITVAVNVDGFVERDFRGVLFLGTEVHQNLILNATRRVGGKLRATRDLKGVYSFAKTYRSDRHEILGILCGGVIFSHDMRNEAEIVQNQLLSCREVALLH